MDFSVTPEQRRLVGETRSFADRLEELSDARDEGVFNKAAWETCAAHGVLGWLTPTDHGGAGHDPVSVALMLEALGLGCSDSGLLFAVNNHLFSCTTYVIDHGSAQQRAEWLPRLAKGTAIGAHALTETEAGSDILALTTRARREDDHFVLDGRKTYISNAPIADLFVVFARTDGEAGASDGISAFLVPEDQPGLSVRPLAKMGLGGTPMGEVTFSGCVLPGSALLGPLGKAYQIFQTGLVWERGFMFATQVGALRRLLDQTVSHCNRRRQFGRPIAANQAVSHRIADAQLHAELARLLLYKLAWRVKEEHVPIKEACMLKLLVSEALKSASLDLLQFQGAAGFLAGSAAERQVRDSLATSIYAGTSEIQRSAIAAMSGLVLDGTLS
ncbi:acyl-CoA dehydrogenase family protein [Nonomuraea sp. NPDC005692]|uniref:acyl-CoA dehydrogenase family protein n=1 Tax=Nonomuraea sp. NPDC005692 TaxID=3157168 RepID=UPI0033E0F800